MSLLQRLAEPSTYAGIAGFLATLGLMGFSESDWQTIFNAAAAIAAAVAIVMPEQGKGDA